MDYQYQCTICNIDHFAYNENERENLLIRYDDLLNILKEFDYELKIIHNKNKYSFDIYSRSDLYIFTSLTLEIPNIVLKKMLFFYNFSMLEFEKFKTEILSEIKENLYETIHNTKNTCIDL